MTGLSWNVSVLNAAFQCIFFSHQFFFSAGSKVDQREDFWGEITWKFKTVEQGSEKKEEGWELPWG